jgi:energy-coupling factor transporter ATP-binding protein EcfA2
MIHIDSFSFTYATAISQALRGINLVIPAGQFCGIVGPNGAGKSTLCYALSGFVPHFYRGIYDGQVIVGGRKMTETALSQLAGEIGLVFQNPFNQISGARFTVREEVAFGLENLAVPREEMQERVAQVLEQTGLSDLADRSPYTLSGGQQQRLAIASMLVMRPKLLVLDEPTSQLDPLGTKEIFVVLHELVKQGETTVILTEHKLERLASSVDRVIVLHDGQIIDDGPPQKVLTSQHIGEYGVPQTRYTRAARLASELGKVPQDRRLPVTLEQAVEYFQ